MSTQLAGGFLLQEKGIAFYALTSAVPAESRFLT